MYSLSDINVILGCMLGIEYEELDDYQYIIVDLLVFQFIFIKQK